MIYAMSIEGGPSGIYEERLQGDEIRVELPFDDVTLRCSSSVTDYELAERHSNGGFAEWEQVA